MKRIIKRLAYLTGVAAEIEQSQRNSTAAQLMSASYWYCSSERSDISNALFLYSQSLQNKGWFNNDKLRESLDRVKGKSLHSSENNSLAEYELRFLGLR